MTALDRAPRHAFGLMWNAMTVMCMMKRLGIAGQ